MTSLRGVFPVLSTAFGANNEIVSADLRKLVTYCARVGAHGIVYPAIASEFATLKQSERVDATNVVLEQCERLGLDSIVGVSARTPEESLELCNVAKAGRAAAVMLMVPKSVEPVPEAIAGFICAATSELNGTEVVLQNAPPPLGSSLPIDILASALKLAPHVRYVKEETVPCGQRMSQLKLASDAQLKGVFGGAGGRFVLDEYARGAAGTMPSCEYVEIHVRIWDLVQQDKWGEARAVFERILPLLNMAAIFRQSVVKEVLFRRGLISTSKIRDDNPMPDPQDLLEISTHMTSIEPLMDGAVELKRGTLQ